MSGWTILILLALAGGVLFWRMGMPRELWSFVGAAAMLGAAGYALQGRPALPGNPVADRTERGTVDTAYVALREAMFGRFNFSYSYFVAADAMTRAGKPDTAVAVMLGGLRKAPQSTALWTGLGIAYVEHDGTISPAARLAFEQAMRIGPNDPGPPFFFGLAHIRQEDFAAARPLWVHALTLAPQGTQRHTEIAQRLALLDRFLQLEADAQGAGPGQ